MRKRAVGLKYKYSRIEMYKCTNKSEHAMMIGRNRGVQNI